MNKKILIIGPAWIGDMVMAQSLFLLLKQRSPSAHLDVLAPARTMGLLSRMPEVRQAIEAPFLHLKFEFWKHYSLARQLRQQNYDQVIILPNSFKSAISPWLAGIKIRTGWLGESRYFALNDIRHLNKSQYPMMIERFMGLGLAPNQPIPKPYPYPQLSISPDPIKTLHKNKSRLFTPNTPILAMCIGAEFGPAKRWPAAYFAEVANHQIKSGWHVWLIGSIKDSPIAREIMQLTHQRCEDLTGQYELTEIIDVLALTTGVLTNDTGLMHIAAAINKPTIVLYGSTSPVFTPPLSPKAISLKLNLPCQPCFKRECRFEHYRCLTELTPSRILSTISEWNIT